MISLDSLVANDHIYRKFNNLVNFDELSNKHLSHLITDYNYKGYGPNILFRALLLQFLEDISDRELAKYLTENTSAKWFCKFSLTDKTPNYSVFSKLRSKIGTHLLAKIFNEVKNQLRSKGYMNEAFSFVDASHLIAKASLWEEQDNIIAKKYHQLNNKNISKVAIDTDAKIGAKGNTKFWF